MAVCLGGRREFEMIGFEGGWRSLRKAIEMEIESFRERLKTFLHCGEIQWWQLHNDTCERLPWVLCTWIFSKCNICWTKQNSKMKCLEGQHRIVLFSSPCKISWEDGFRGESIYANIMEIVYRFCCWILSSKAWKGVCSRLCVFSCNKKRTKYHRT